MEGYRRAMASTLRRIATLTPFQARIIARYAGDTTTAQIAREEYVSKRKIEQEMEAMRAIFRVNATHAVIMKAHELGYISHPDDDGVIHAQSPFLDRQ